jgi:hypothetical protein
MITALPKRKQTRLPLNIDLERAARRAVREHVHFRGRNCRFQFEQRGDVLIARGRVPSFYLKHLVGAILRRIHGVREVENQIDVVCCDGLSSVRAEA